MSVYRKLNSSPTSESSNELLSDDDLKFEGIGHEVAGTGSKRRNVYDPCGACSARFCIICTLINVAIVAFLPSNPAVSAAARTDALFSDSIVRSTFSREDINKLRRPSQFVRFDEIQRPTPPIPRQFNNHPMLIAQVDYDHPNQVFGETKRRYMAAAGTITPEDRRVLVTPSVRCAILLLIVLFAHR